MGLYFRPKDWFTKTGAGECAGSEEGGSGAWAMSGGKGLAMAVPKGRKDSAVRRVGWIVMGT
jgi:hypothetical protein